MWGQGTSAASGAGQCEHDLALFKQWRVMRPRGLPADLSSGAFKQCARL